MKGFTTIDFTEPPPAETALGDNEVHVWRASLDQPAGVARRWQSLLSAAELARAARHRLERDRDGFVVAHGVLRWILGRYLGAAPASLRFVAGPHGKPGLENGPRFNLSHSDGLALYAVARDREVGIDVERIRPGLDTADIAERFLPASESLALRRLSGDAALGAFYAAWTRTEALLKAKGCGWDGAAGAVNVGAESPPTFRRSHRLTDAGWSCHLFQPCPGYLATVAVEGHGCDLGFRQVET
jgi:4'-phosphopantetheinyl transferase